jgi:hypothetical protein
MKNSMKEEGLSEADQEYAAQGGLNADAEYRILK